MKRRTFVSGVTGGIALTAGCVGSLGGSDPKRGTVRFYVTDEPNRIDDFRALDVTISSVAFKPAGADDEADIDDETDWPATTSRPAGTNRRPARTARATGTIRGCVRTQI